MPPTIFFSTNTGSNSYHADCIRRVYAEINTPSFCSQFQVVTCITNDSLEILQKLQSYEKEIVFFYFDGRDEHFQGLIDASFRAGLGSLVEYLAHSRYLDLIFLSYCSRSMFVQPLLQAGIETVVGTSHHLPQTQTTEFATIFCQHYLIYGQTTGNAYNQAIDGSGILSGPQDRQFAGLHGDSLLRLRRWWHQQCEAKPHIVGDPPFLEPRIIGAVSTSDLPPLPATLQPPITPFPGARPYLAKDAAVFLGREQEIGALYNQISTAHQQPITLLYGQSGVGKSSLLKAGLWPRLSDQYTRLYLNGEKKPHLFKALRHLIKAEDQTTITKQQWRDWLPQQKHDFLLIIDQFETQLLPQNSANEDDLKQLMAAIDTLLQGPASSNRPRIIFSVREENLTQCRELLADHHLQSRTQEFRLSPLNESGIRTILHSFAPSSTLATHYDFAIENEVAERVVADMIEDPHSPMAPFLQAILVKLWEEAAKTKPRPLSLQHYQQLYDTGTILRDFFDARIAEVRRQWFPLFHYKKLIDLLAAYTSLAETARERSTKAKKATERTTTSLKKIYLLTEKAGGPANKLYLGHKLLEAPITQQFYRFTKDYTWFERQRFEFDFMVDQLKARVVQQTSPAKQKKTPSISRLPGWFNQKTELTRGLVAFLTFLILLTLLTSFTLLFLFTFRQLLQPTLQQAVASSSVSQPNTLTVSATIKTPSADPIVEVAPGQPSFAVKLNRISILYGYGALPLTYTNQRGSILTFSPNSALLFAGGGDNTIEVWRVLGLQSLPILLVPMPSIVLTSVNSQGDLLIYTTQDGSVGQLRFDGLGRIVPAQPNEPMELLRHKGPFTAVQLSKDATLLVTGGQDGVLYQYDLQTRQLATLSSEPADSISAVAIHPSKQFIAYAGANQRITLWDRSTAAVSHQLVGHTGRVNSLEFSQDGGRLLSASSDGTVCIWQLANGTREYCFGDHTKGANVAHYSPDGTLILVASNDSSIAVWDAVSYRRLDTVEAHPSGVSDLAISADGRYLASAGWDSSIALWEISVSTDSAP